MTQEIDTNAQAQVYRVNRFAVPSEARSEFVVIFRRMNDFLRSQPGVRVDIVLEQPAEPGAFNFVSIIAFESQAIVEKVRDAIAAFQKTTNFDRQGVFARLGIVGDQSNYVPIAA